MNYWIFTVTSHKLDGETLTGDDILQQRVQDRFWGLGEKTPNRRALQKGDQIVFYVGIPRKAFAATATLASDSFKTSEDEKQTLSHGKRFYRADYGVRLESIQVWTTLRSTEDLVPQLDFIENKASWFAYFQGGVRQVSEKDFRTITEGREHTLVERIARVADLESESQFALESHLEEFIDQNWSNIDFGSKLKLYSADDQNGRQFPAGPWSIDFLCVDEVTNDLVVVELKRGKTSDSTVGQVLRYISWVREHIAKHSQKVRGIIIAKEVDDALHYAVKDIPDLSVLTYKVDFRLAPTKK
ncbi:MAG: endonuclease NucS domain-containing protein [Verrucomicrobiia bacterium]